MIQFEKSDITRFLQNLTLSDFAVSPDDKAPVSDPRRAVVQQESAQIVAAVEGKGREAEYVVLEDGRHGFTKKENEIYVYKKILEFFNTHIHG